MSKRRVVPIEPWTTDELYTDFYTCSNCQLAYAIAKGYKYCSNCGGWVDWKEAPAPRVAPTRVQNTARLP